MFYMRTNPKNGEGIQFSMKNTLQVSNCLISFDYLSSFDTVRIIQSIIVVSTRVNPSGTPQVQLRLDSISGSPIYLDWVLDKFRALPKRDTSTKSKNLISMGVSSGREKGEYFEFSQKFI